MMFCPKCHLLLYPKNGKMVCRKCGYETEGVESHVIVEEHREKEISVLGKEEEALPKTNVTCPKCGNNEAYWILRQTRSADEPETRIYTCTRCGHRWREY